MREYVFINKEGEEFYQIVGQASDVQAFMKMHSAVKAMPLDQYEKRQESKHAKPIKAKTG